MWNRYGVFFGGRVRPPLGLEIVLKKVTITVLREDGIPWESAEHDGI